MNKIIRHKINEYFIYFILYSNIGWLYEVFLETVIYRWGFSNRGTLTGPVCVIYGFGALLIIFLFDKFNNRKIKFKGIKITPILVFLASAATATVVELAGSYIMEFTKGSWDWNYERFAFNFQGRIALNPSIRFGIGATVFLYIIHPLFKKLIKKIGKKHTRILSVVLFAILAADIVFTFLI